MSEYAVKLPHLALFALVVAAAAGLRLAGLGADPPLLLSTSNSEVMDGPWYLATAADRARGEPPHVPPQYDRPIFTAAARAAFALGGVSLETAHAMAALWGVALVVFGALGAWQAFGTRTGLLAALFLATSFVLTGYGRVPLVYGPLAAGLAAAFWFHALGLRRHPGFHLLAVAAVAGLAAGLKVAALALAPALAAGHIVAARSRARALALVAAVLALGAVAAAALLPGEVAALAGKASGYFGADTGPLALLKRIANAPVASGLALKATALLALAWLGVLLAIARRPMRELEAVVERRLDDALDATLVTWLLATILIHAPFRFDPSEHAIPLRHFAPALVPAAILAARALVRLAEGIEIEASRARVFFWALAGGYVLISCGWHAIKAWLARDGAPLPGWFPLAASFNAILAVAAAVAAAAASSAGRGARSLRASPAMAAALAALTLASEAALLAPALASPTYTLRDANAAVARALPPDAVVEGSFAHALTYDAPVARRFDEVYRGYLGATHLACEADKGAGLEREFARAKAPLEPVLDLEIRGYPVRLYRYAWARPGGEEGGRAPPAPLGPGAPRGR